MVKKALITFILLLSFANGDVLDDKIREFVDSDTLKLHKNLISKIFQDKEQFYTQNRLDDFKLLSKLKENGLLNLAFKKPTNITITLRSDGETLMFVKLISETMKELGYYYFVTQYIKKDELGTVWTINFTSEYSLDPVNFISELQKHGSKILNVSKKSNVEWDYIVDISKSTISKTIKSENGQNLSLKKPLNDYWIEIENSSRVKIYSDPSDSWYPYVVFYDKNLNILKIYKNDGGAKNISIDVLNGTKYIKISDIYTLGNIKRGLKVVLE